ncbi:MAG: outer membrane lipoprotein-sorting protein [Candidatus Eisenbacteria bacterium]|nr:outer membrane lipoprotein-sorting protein [Candidatus Eisenbacteria bacterium]
MRDFLINIAIRRPKWVLIITALITLAFLAQFPRIKIDTDPENMLPENEQVRVFHSEVKENFNLRDFLVLGIVHEAGMFTPERLARVQEMTNEIRELDGVITDDLLAPADVDDITVEEGGILRVSPLMGEAPEDQAGADLILERIRQNPILRGKLASDDGRAIALFIPLESKDISFEIAQKITTIANNMGGDEEYYLAGQPVAQDTFGAAMFKQMAVSAPLAGLVIFLLMLFFFREPRTVGTAMLVAVMSVIWVMGALIGTGFTVHIMSSMIPIFLIPIAILPSIHILSDMYDRRGRCGSTEEAVRQSLTHLFKPILFTTITTIVGFGSLMLTPIPPVQIFGGFVAAGILAAWLMSMTFLPALVMLESHRGKDPLVCHSAKKTGMANYLQTVRRLSMRGRWAVTGVSVLILIFSIIGLSKIRVNDNPVRWFKSNHPLRVADRIMNEHLAGTYIAYLELGGDEEGRIKDPEVMTYIESLQKHLMDHSNVGATSSVADVVKKVGFELAFEDPEQMVIPDSREAVAQYLFLYEMSGGNPDDLYHFITPEANKAIIWVQMHEGDNNAVQSVVESAEIYMAANPIPDGLEKGWAGLSYVNIVWQDKMVKGMGKALLGSFITVFIMMTILFRSLIWGLVSMLPLTGTIAFIYGLLGWFGKDYDMPVAVLSSLTLGLSIDFAIHFIQRSREIHKETKNYEETMIRTFEGTGRAIFRNVMVLAIGFVPMLFASLTPYFTVGLFFFLIMMVSGLVTLVLLPAITALRPSLFYAAAAKQRKSRLAPAAATAVLLLFAGQALMPLISPVEAAETDAVEIMKQAHMNLFYAGDDGIAEVKMTLVDKNGREREREFTMLRWDGEDGGEQRYYTYFNKPADVRRTTFMVIKQVDKDDDRWIYIPAVDLVRRISSNDKNSSFVGSDFSYEDVSGRHWLDDAHELTGEGELDGTPVYIVKSTPNDGAKWAYRISYIDRERRLPLKEEYFDKKDEMIRLFTADEIKEIDGFSTVTTRTMKDLKRDHHTVVTFSEVKYNVGVEPDIFAERYLKNPPREYIK